MIEKDVLLISVGSAPTQTIYSLKVNHPKYVIFVVSNATYSHVEQIKREASLELIATEQIHIENNENDINTCYKKIIRALASILERWGKNYNDLIVDYTGGTKPMSAAIVLSTIELSDRYCYIGGGKREGPGMRVVTGSELPVFQANPWEELCVRDLDKVDLMFSRARYKTAFEILKSTIEKVDEDKKEILKIVKDIIEGYLYWDDFRHQKAISCLNKGVYNLRKFKLINKKIIGKIVDIAQIHLNILKEALTGQEKDSKFLIKDIISNAHRRINLEHKYDDAIARLYSAIERVAKFRLFNFYGIDNSSTKPEQIPEKLKPTFKKYFDEEKGIYQFGFIKSFELLCALGDETGIEYEKCKIEIKKIIDMRNQSILGHGNDPVNSKLCNQMFEFVLNFAGLKKDDLFAFPDINIKELFL